MRSTLSSLSLVLASAVTVVSLHTATAVAQSTATLQSPAPIEVGQSVQQRQVPRSERPQRVTPSSSLSPTELNLTTSEPQFPDIECPEGTYLVIWDQPIYDDEGLFIIGYEPTPYCIDEDTEPAG